jgi:hippurate hydrolase
MSSPDPCDLDEVVGWRQNFHRHPELMYDLPWTAAQVAALLTSFGLDDVTSGVGRSGVVGVLHGRSGGGQRVIGLRSDMDALPIHERTHLRYASVTAGRMHACGHDGHMAMLLGAARQLARCRDFGGTIVFIFQPAEEGGAGGKAMVDDGLLERWAIEEVYGMHNMPGIPVGYFAIRPGPLMASTENFTITLSGRGGHAATPHLAIDPNVAANMLALALQTVVARSVDPLESAVVSVTRQGAGDASNVIADTAMLGGTVRTLSPEVRVLVERRIRTLAAGIAQAFEMIATVDWQLISPVVVNDAAATGHAAAAARTVAGSQYVVTDTRPIMVGEDFAYMLVERPGALIFTGNGPSADLHSAAYDFDDRAIPRGIAWWVQLARDRLP